jgi:hypothetical protein
MRSGIVFSSSFAEQSLSYCLKSWHLMLDFDCCDCFVISLIYGFGFPSLCGNIDQPLPRELLVYENFKLKLFMNLF